MTYRAKHQPCACGCGEMADECMSGRSNPLAAFTMTDDVTPEQRSDWVTLLQAERRKGADQLHHRAAFTKPVTLTDAESAAIARATIDRRTK